MVACGKTLLQSVPMVACEDRNVFKDILSSSDTMLQERKYNNINFDGFNVLDDLFKHTN